MRILVTGGAGFIGSNFIRHILNKYKKYKITNLDKLTYAGNLANLEDIRHNRNYCFVKGDICNERLVRKLVNQCDCLINFAAATHVDRSIKDAADFIQTNVCGTYALLEAAKKSCLDRFVQISCYDEKTMALTTDGLKTYKELKDGDLVFSLNPKTLEIEVKPIEKIIIQHYKGKMVHFGNKRIDLLVTPNHNMFIFNTQKKLAIETAQEASQRSIFYMPEGYWKGRDEEYLYIKDYGKVKTKDLMYILGIFIGDGFISYQEKQEETKTGLARDEYLKSSRDKLSGRFRKIERQGNHQSVCHGYRIFFDIPENDKCRKGVERALSGLGIKYHCHKGKAGAHLYFTSKSFMEFFAQCGEGANNKHIPRWALDYSREYLKYLLNGLMDSDGHGGKILYTSSKRLTSDVSELCVKLNLKPSIHKRHTVSFMQGRRIEGQSYYVFVAKTSKSITKLKNRTIDYEGNIWCLKVKDNRNFLVERNGKFDFCGNTDEVYGSCEEGVFTEESPLLPNSPYAASKVSGDCLARSYSVTYGLPVIITRSSNNFGPYQYPEKVIPLFITNLLIEKKLPLYGDGLNRRDWIFVLDNCRAIDTVLHKGRKGEIYNIAAGNEITNIALTKKILKLMAKDERFIQYVKDRPGHDRRYALDIAKLKSLGWRQKFSFNEALGSTIDWYKNNQRWWKALKRVF